MKSANLTFNENNSLAEVCIVREGKTVLQAMVDVMTENGTAGEWRTCLRITLYASLYMYLLYYLTCE